MINENYPQIDLSQWQQVGKGGNGSQYGELRQGPGHR